MLTKKKNPVKKIRNWRKTKEYRTWRFAVIKRDKRCVICHALKARHAHHLESAFYNVGKRFTVSNGITLCRECHTNFHTNFKRSYRIKTTAYDFENFKTLANYFKHKL